MWPLGPLARAADHTVDPARRPRCRCSPAFGGGAGWHPEGLRKGSGVGEVASPRRGSHSRCGERPLTGSALKSCGALRWGEGGVTPRQRVIGGSGRGGGASPTWWRKAGRSPVSRSVTARLELLPLVRVRDVHKRQKRTQNASGPTGAGVTDRKRGRVRELLKRSESPYYLIRHFCMISRFTHK